MNLIVVVTFAFLSLTAAGVGAAAIPDESQARIVAYESTSDPDGSYNFSYETSNGIRRSESGFLINVGKEDEHIVVTGSYSYTDTDGKTVTVIYTADENGFQIQQPQPILGVPPAVVASLLGK